MPGGLLPDEGLADQLAAIIGVPLGSATNWQLFLFVNDVTPTCDTVLDDLDEATFDGYSRKQLDRSTWTTPEVSECCATSTYGTDPIVYLVEGETDETVYGVAYVDPTSNVIRFVQRLDDADIAPLQDGGQFQILPQYTLTSANCSASMAKARRLRNRRAKGERRG